MLPRADILAWRADHAPWADEDDVEQDLLLTRALCDVFADDFLNPYSKAFWPLLPADTTR